MGVLGWTYDQTLDTPMQAIVAALRARDRHVTTVLKCIAGFLGAEIVEPDAPPPVTNRKLTPQIFDAIFAGNNGK